MRSKHVLTAAALLSTSALAAEKLTPVQKEAKASFEKSISNALKTTNTACGTRLKVITNFNWFEPKQWEGVSYDAYCIELLNGMASLCERPEYKKALAKKVTGVACQFSLNAQAFGMIAVVGSADKKDGDKDTVPRNISLWRGVLTYNMKEKDVNIADTTRAVLEEALGSRSK